MSLLSLRMSSGHLLLQELDLVLDSVLWQMRECLCSWSLRKFLFLLSDLPGHLCRMDFSDCDHSVALVDGLLTLGKLSLDLLLLTRRLRFGELSLQLEDFL